MSRPIGYYTDNCISQSVMRSFSRSGVRVQHINDGVDIQTPAIFYGILRGTGISMRYMQWAGRDFHYLDNGYFGAVYMDEHKRKDLSGKYRVVKNGMIEPCDVKPIKMTPVNNDMRVMLMPPSPYSAFMYDTTPEDWLQECVSKCNDAGIKYHVKEKDNFGGFEEAVRDFDAVLAFNSIAVMKAVDLGKAVYTTHGVIKNANLFGFFAPYYDLHEIEEYYRDKQFTLEQIEDLGVECLQ